MTVDMEATTTDIHARAATPSANSTTTTMSPQEPPSPTAPVCYFTDKLSAEIRVRIYGFVFPEARARRINPVELPTQDGNAHLSSKASLANIDSNPGDASQVAPDAKQRIATDIFAANKLIHKESIEAFYDTTIISATFEEFDHLLDLSYCHSLIRNVEIVSCNTQLYRARYVSDLLLDAQELPRLKTFTILSDCLTPTGAFSTHTIVRQFAISHGLGPVSCIDIGEYRLDGQFKGITFTHRKLSKLWPQVASTPDDFAALKDVMSLVEGSVSGALSNVMAWGAHTSFRLWIGLLQEFFDLSQDMSFQDIMLLGCFRQALVGEIPSLAIIRYDN